MLQHQKHRRKRARSAFFEYKSRRADEYSEVARGGHTSLAEGTLVTYD